MALREDRRRRTRLIGAAVLGVFFLTAGALYYTGWYVFDPRGTDYTGLVMLLSLGFAMGFMVWLLVTASREL